MVGRTSIMAIIGGTFTKLGGGKFANEAMSAAFTHLFNGECSRHGACRKYNPKVHLEHAKMYDNVATWLGRAGIVTCKIYKPAGSILLGASAYVDGLKHMSLYLANKFDTVGLTIDYVVPVAFRPYGPAIGEVVSQSFENLNNYLEKNYK